MRVWLADLLMLGGACAVVAGSPFGLAWYLVPHLIAAGIATALLGLAAAPGWWRAGVFAGIALSWLPVGLVILIGLGVGRFVWPGRRVTERRLVAADSLVLASGGCLVIGVWFGGWMVPLAIGAAAAVASFLLDRRRPWRAALLAAVLVVTTASLCGGDGGGSGESAPVPRSGPFHGQRAVARIASPPPESAGAGAARLAAQERARVRLRRSERTKRM